MKDTYLTLLLLMASTYCSYGQPTLALSNTSTENRNDGDLQMVQGATSWFYETFNLNNF